MTTEEALGGTWFDIWAEGYRATGEHGTATYMGRALGKDFRDACLNFAKQERWPRDLFDHDRLAYWCCKLFDNEKDARKAFG